MSLSLTLPEASRSASAVVQQFLSGAFGHDDHRVGSLQDARP